MLCYINTRCVEISTVEWSMKICLLKYNTTVSILGKFSKVSVFLQENIIANVAQRMLQLFSGDRTLIGCAPSTLYSDKLIFRCSCSHSGLCALWNCGRRFCERAYCAKNIDGTLLVHRNFHKKSDACKNKIDKLFLFVKQLTLGPNIYLLGP